MFKVASVWVEIRLNCKTINENVRFKCRPCNLIIQLGITQRTDHIIGLKSDAHPSILGPNEYPRAEIKSTVTATTEVLFKHNQYR